MFTGYHRGEVFVSFWVTFYVHQNMHWGENFIFYPFMSHEFNILGNIVYNFDGKYLPSGLYTAGHVKNQTLGVAQQLDVKYN